MTKPTPPYRIGIDLGGTKIEALLLSPDNKTLLRHRTPTPRGGGSASEYAAIRDAVVQTIQETKFSVPAGERTTIGVGIPGTIQPDTGLVQNANTTSLIGQPFQKDLEAVLGRPIGMENDANCFTLAESRMGAGRGYDMVFGVIMGTGCGGGFCIKGELHTGRHRIAGEWGHFSVDPLGQRCYCGNPGCIETKISGGGVAKTFARRYGRSLTLEQITTGYRNRNDPQCTTTFEQFLDDYGRCMGGLISILDPDAVILGGGVSNIEELYTLGLERVRHYAFHQAVQTPILKNQLGDSAGVFGAAWVGQ